MSRSYAKFLMIFSALFMFCLGVVLTFAPGEVVEMAGGSHAPAPHCVGAGMWRSLPGLRDLELDGQGQRHRRHLQPSRGHWKLPAFLRGISLLSFWIRQCTDIQAVHLNQENLTTKLEPSSVGS